MAKIVYGFGDPVLDIVARVDDALLEALGAEPGGCAPVSAEEMQCLLDRPEVQANMICVPGGSAANVMKGLAGLAGVALGQLQGQPEEVAGQGQRPEVGSLPLQGQVPQLQVSFIGMVGADSVGSEYRRAITVAGVHPLLLESTSGAATATCLCLVTPDGQRTMRTALCAALELNSPEQLPAQLAAQGHASGPAAEPSGTAGGGTAGTAGGGTADTSSMALLHCEGYSLYRPVVTAAAMRAAQAAGAAVSLDLASFEVIQNCWSQLQGLLQEGLVNVIFCNEQEAQAFCKTAGLDFGEGAGADEAVAATQDLLLSHPGVRTVVVSRGAKGCFAKPAGGKVVAAQASSVQVVDTVGAGDYFTAGFLFGLLSGASLQACASCGCAAGTAAVGCAGAELGAEALQRLQVTISSILAADAEAAAAPSTETAKAG